MAIKPLYPQPPWYKRTEAQVPKYLPFIKAKRSPFPNTTLQVITQAPKTKGQGWGGSWSIDSTGHITIFFEKRLWDGCLAKGLLYEIVHTLQHEYMEAKLSVTMARSKFPDRNPYVMAETDERIGGLAHYQTIKELDDLTEEVYDSWLYKIDKFLKSRG